MRLLFFGPLKDISAGAQRDLALPEGVATVEGLIAHMAAQEPALAQALSALSVRIAVNKHIVPRGHIITDSDEIAFLPPFSGG